MADLNEFQRRARADRLNAVRQDLDSVLAEMDERYVQRWRNSTTAEAREDAHRYVTLLGDFRKQMAAIALDGKTAADAIALEERRKGWKIPGLRTG